MSIGFTDLPLNDQMRLLQVSWAEILTLTLAFRSIPFTGRLYFATDFWLDERSAKECGATELYNHVRIFIFFSFNFFLYEIFHIVHSNNATFGENLSEQGGILFVESFNTIKL